MPAATTGAMITFAESREGAEELGNIGPDHYVFPACENGHINLTVPMKGWRTAWCSLTMRAGLSGFRFHDLRHHAITELAEFGFSDQTVMSIAGHVSREMLDHYSHILLTAERRALEAIETPIPEPQPAPEESAPVTVN